MMREVHSQPRCPFVVKSGPTVGMEIGKGIFRCIPLLPRTDIGFFIVVKRLDRVVKKFTDRRAVKDESIRRSNN